MMIFGNTRRNNSHRRPAATPTTLNLPNIRGGKEADSLTASTSTTVIADLNTGSTTASSQPRRATVASGANIAAGQSATNIEDIDENAGKEGGRYEGRRLSNARDRRTERMAIRSALLISVT